MSAKPPLQLLQQNNTQMILTRRLITLLTVLCSATVGIADDWGHYSIVPVSAPKLVLEAVDSGTSDGTVVSIGRPADTSNQKWIVQPNGDGLYVIRPSYSSTLVLAIDRGGERNGTQVVLETDSGKPWQLWTLNPQENGSYTLVPRHAPNQGLDHFGGKNVPGAKVDLWENRPGDRHLQWYIRPLAGSPVPAAAVDAASDYVPPVLKPEEILAGEIREFQFNTSEIFPGTVRDVTIFIPAQYDGSKPACVYVKTDGYRPQEKTMLETMIASKEMPVTIGVFVRPGEVPAPMPGTLGRRNRDFEYDGISDNNVRFLVDELLPHIAKEFKLNLSTDGNDRCMAGGSSGGIAAFTAAWNRPDAFSRVYAASGSWVAFRGGHEFPTMVRKFEARPIRAFLTTATRDMENVAGDWFLLDQQMDKALKFSGYDYQFRIVDGPHVAGYSEHWQEAMAYLWRGWPERVQTGPSAPRAQEILIPGEGWELLADGFKSTRGPACNAAGEVYFADTTSDRIHRIELDGTVSVFATDTGNAHCVTVGADGTVFTISERSGNLMSYDAAGNGSVVMDGILGHSLLARPDGSLYVTTNGEKAHGPGSVWLIKDGQKTQVDSGIKFATGMTYRPDQWLLSVAEGHSKWVYSYQINDDGTLTNKGRFFHLHVADWDDDAGTESVCYSIEGRQFVATRSGIQISADDGPTQVILPVPDFSRVTGVCLGGRDGDTLFAFCGNRIWKRKIQHHAMGAFSPWVKVNATKL
jgi:gluconolactonase